MDEAKRSEQVVVVGTGPAGLSAAAMLRRHGIDPLVLEAADAVAASWRRRYDSLRLNSPRLNSTLAGYRIPRRYGRWLKKDDLVEYLDDYARLHRLRLSFGTTLNAVRRGDGTSGRFIVVTSRGEIATDFVVLATGHDAEPKIPHWPGRETFAGELIHSSVYKNPEPFRGKSVLVVSARNSGTEIACELATRGGCRVWTSMRTPPNIFPREWPPGIPLSYLAVLMDPFPDVVLDRAGAIAQRLIYGKLDPYGIPEAPFGLQTATRRHHLSVLVDDGYIDALKAGKIEIVPPLESFEGPDAIFAGDRRVQPDVVIAATGYHTTLPSLVGHLGVLDERGFPSLDGRSLRSREHPNAPGLFFNGFHVSGAGQLRFMRIDGRRIARTIARQLRPGPSAERRSRRLIRATSRRSDGPASPDPATDGDAGAEQRRGDEG